MRQTDREFGVGARLALDRDRAAVLLGDDVVANRQTQARALAGGLGREERLEQPVPDLGRYAGAVVAYLDLDRITCRTGRHLQGRLELRVVTRALLLVGRIEAVAEQIEE